MWSMCGNNIKWKYPWGFTGSLVFITKMQKSSWNRPSWWSWWSWLLLTLTSIRAPKPTQQKMLWGCLCKQISVLGTVHNDTRRHHAVRCLSPEGKSAANSLHQQKDESPRRASYLKLRDCKKYAIGKNPLWARERMRASKSSHHFDTGLKTATFMTKTMTKKIIF